MTIGIQILREGKPGGDLARVRASEKKRFRDPKVVDDVIELDQQWVKAQFNTEQKRKEVSIVQKKITERKKANNADKCEDLVKEKTELEAEVAELVKESDGLMKKRDTNLLLIGNLVPPTKEEDEKEGHDDLAVFKDEDHNLVTQTWGTPRSFEGIKYGSNGFRPHFELLEMIGAVEFEAGRDVAGERAYFLMGPGVLLNQALINYGIAFLSMKGYMPVQPPFFMKKDLMAKTAELADYDEVLYKVVEDKERPELDKYLIATSEQPISAMHRGKNIDQGKFPIRYAGISSCFRREAGSHGRDIRGIFRVHQFEKVEQFVYTSPEDSWAEHEKMIGLAAEFWQSLGIPYQVISIVTGALNNSAAKKFDLEGWFPGDDDGKGKYRELVSCSNCLDYQARAMSVKYGYNPTDPFCHMLNSTLCATERGLCCLVENYQEADGVRVPRALQPFMLGKEFLPFVKLLKETKDKPTAGGKQEKQGGGKQDKQGGVKQEKQEKQETPQPQEKQETPQPQEKQENPENQGKQAKQEKQGKQEKQEGGKKAGKKK